MVIDYEEIRFSIVYAEIDRLHEVVGDEGVDVAEKAYRIIAVTEGVAGDFYHLAASGGRAGDGDRVFRVFSKMEYVVGD